MRTLSKHLKRLNLSRAVQVPRKESKFTFKPRSGPHGKDRSIALATILRDYLNLAGTGREAKRIVASRAVLVDGKVITDHKYPVGIMDVVSIPSINKHFRVLFDTKGKLRLVEISENDATWKLSRIENIGTVKGGKFQISLHDGRNIIVDEKKYNTGDVLKIDLKTGQILEHLPFSEGYYAYIIGGKNVGRIAKIEDYKVVNAITPNMVKFKEGFETTKYNTFVVGSSKPLIQIPEVNLNEQ